MNLRYINLMQGMYILGVELPARSNQYLPWSLEFKLQLHFILLESLSYKVLCGNKDFDLKKKNQFSIIISVRNWICSGNDADTTFHWEMKDDTASVSWSLKFSCWVGGNYSCLQRWEFLCLQTMNQSEETILPRK